MLLEETSFAWHETLGVPPNALAETIRLAMRRLALRYHPDQGGTAAQMTRINAAYTEATATLGSHRTCKRPSPPRS